MKKKITRYMKNVIVELVKDVNGTEIVIDTKTFSRFLGAEPNQSTYDKANKWADNAIQLHLKNVER